MTAFLPSLFWLLILFGLDKPSVAAATVLAALIHELGHELAAFLNKGYVLGIRTDLSGFRIKNTATSSYLSDIILYSGGPLANIAAGLIILIIPFEAKDYPALFSTVNIMTAISNLLPIRGYDGFGILSSLIHLRSREDRFMPLLHNISFIFIIAFTFLSLYIVGRIGGSYWMAGLFLILLTEETGARLKNNFR